MHTMSHYPENGAKIASRVFGGPPEIIFDLCLFGQPTVGNLRFRAGCSGRKRVLCVCCFRLQSNMAESACLDVSQIDALDCETGWQMSRINKLHRMQDLYA